MKTGKDNRCFQLVVPRNLFYICVKLHFFVYTHRLQGFEDEGLFFWGKADIPSSLLEIGVAAEPANEHLHELLVLFREHPFLEISEPFCKGHRFVAAIVWTGLVLGAFTGINQLHEFRFFNHCFVSGPVQAGHSKRAVAVQADRKARGWGGVELLGHG